MITSRYQNALLIFSFAHGVEQGETETANGAPSHGIKAHRISERKLFNVIERRL
ncbi:hypothetical protein B1R32_1414 [Abditibacterium utsteinense]|uniref:Uncharacterized protein n=1 Tax=Abditibacterium utsteinense TaxID=1960156 RepID=A0A2S8SNM2_9BACT|nr:hypothetical protein [Abditibacterium utsteinense]PQV62394.1 hypothetical protein B1R32_1414 [Abditibacterium utsteinense]